MRRSFFIFTAVLFGALLLPGSHGQTPAPIVIQAATPVPAVAPRPAIAAPAATAETTTQLLQEMQAANAATIKKQEAALATLDELQKAAEEIKIYSKRG